MNNRQPMIIETMTLNEAVDALRGLGMKTTAERVGLMLEEGLYPWGVCVRGSRGKSRIVEIYTRKFWEWVNEIAVPDPDGARITEQRAKRKTAQWLAPLDRLHA